MRPGVGKKAKLSREEKARLNEEMWAAVDSRDMDRLKRCLEEGADPNPRRNSMPPLWSAIQAGQYELAHVLLEAGANIRGLGPNSQSVWAAIAPRNNVEEGEWIKQRAGGEVFGVASEMCKHRAWELFTWWLQQPGSTPIPVPRRAINQAEYYSDWLMAGLHGPEELIDLVNQAWGIDPNDPQSLTHQRGTKLARLAWEEIARRDDVHMAKRALRKGWAPPLPEDYTPQDAQNPNVEHWWGLDLGWFFLSKRAVRLWSWWTSVSAIKERFLDDGRKHPDQTVWPLVRDVPTLDRLIAQGMEWTGRGPDGNLLLHHLAQTKTFGPAMVRWWLKHHPEAFDQANDHGVRPLDMPLGESTHAKRAQARGMVMEARIAQGSQSTRTRTRF